MWPRFSGKEKKMARKSSPVLKIALKITNLPLQKWSVWFETS